MDNAQLKCFLTVAKTLNFSEAAKENFVSQSTISRYIKDLEKEFGVKLFERTKREVSLTNEGKILLPYAQEMLNAYNKANSVISNIHNGFGGKINIAYDMISGYFAKECLKSFNIKYPDIQINITQVSNINELLLSSSDYDLYFMPRDLLPDTEKINFLVTHSECLNVVASTSAEVNKKTAKTQKFILLSENINPILYMELMDMFRTFHFTPEKITTVDDVQSVIMEVKAEMGVAILPSELAKIYQNSEIKVIKFDDIDTDIEFVAAWRKDFSNPVLPLFIDIINQLAEPTNDSDYIL